MVRIKRKDELSKEEKRRREIFESILCIMMIFFIITQIMLPETGVLGMDVKEDCGRSYIRTENDSSDIGYDRGIVWIIGNYFSSLLFVWKRWKLEKISIRYFSRRVL